VIATSKRCGNTKHLSTRQTDPVNQQQKAVRSYADADDRHLTTAAARLFNWRTGVYFNIRFVAGGRRWTHPVLYLGSHRYKSLLDVGCTFCTCFKERDAQLVGILLQFTFTTHHTNYEHVNTNTDLHSGNKLIK